MAILNALARAFTTYHPYNLQYPTYITIDGKQIHGKWLTGNYVQSKHYYRDDEIIHAIFTSDCRHDSGATYTNAGWYEVLPESLCWYTGMIDKNNERIYTNHIVRVEGCTTGYGLNNDLAIVSYLQQECGFVLILPNGDRRLGHRATGSSYCKDTQLEVVGNIFSNPELVKEESK